MGFDTGYAGAGDPSGGFLDDPEFLAQLGGYSDAQPTGGLRPGGGNGIMASPWAGAGGGPGYGGTQIAPPSLPDGSPATGGMSGGTPRNGPPSGGTQAQWGFSPVGEGFGAGSSSLFGAPPQQPQGPWQGSSSGGVGRGGPPMGGTRQMPWGGGGWYGGYGGAPAPRPWREQRPPAENPGAAYDAGPGRWEAQQQAAAPPQQPPGSPRLQMPQGGAYGNPMPQRRRRFYGNTGRSTAPGGQGY